MDAFILIKVSIYTFGEVKWKGIYNILYVFLRVFVDCKLTFCVI
jgi:hypothetical protein